MSTLCFVYNSNAPRVNASVNFSIDGTTPDDDVEKRLMKPLEKTLGNMVEKNFPLFCYVLRSGN